MLTGERVLVVDCTGSEERADERLLAHAQRALAELACPSVALCRPRPGRPSAELAARCDVRAGTPEDLARVIGAIDAHPLASLALVQLLRRSEHVGIHEGLVAESLVYSVLQSGPEFAAWLAGREPVEPRDELAPAVRVERAGPRLELVLDRPAKHNAFSAAMRDGLAEGLRIATADASISEIVLRGEGPSFCSGGDLDEFGSLPDPATAHAVRSTRSPARLVAECADRLRAHVHGACMGAGVELPAFAGHVRAERDAFFQLPELAFGLVPGAGGTVSLPRRIGRQRTAWLALTGERLDAETALAWGLVDALA